MPNKQFCHGYRPSHHCQFLMVCHIEPNTGLWAELICDYFHLLCFKSHFWFLTLESGLALANKWYYWSLPTKTLWIPIQAQPPSLWSSVSSSIKWDKNLGHIYSWGVFRELQEITNIKNALQVVKCSTHLHVVVTKGRARDWAGHSVQPPLALTCSIPPSPVPLVGGQGWCCPLQDLAQLQVSVGWNNSGSSWNIFKCTSSSRSNLNRPPNSCYLPFGAC